MDALDEGIRRQQHPLSPEGKDRRIVADSDLRIRRVIRLLTDPIDQSEFADASERGFLPFHQELLPPSLE